MPALGKLRALTVPLVVVVLALCGGLAVTVLTRETDASRQSQIQIKSVLFSLAALENDPFGASPQAGGSPSRARAAIAADEGTLTADVGGLLAAGSAPGPLRQVPLSLRRLRPTVQQIYEIGATTGYVGARLNRLQGTIARQVAATTALLTDAARTYSGRAARSRQRADIGIWLTIAALLASFGFFYRRATLARSGAERLSNENERLLELSRDEAITDPLTGLGNRRAYKQALEAILPAVDADRELLVVMFDLNGFKRFNDTFGHPAGDALLSRLAGRLKQRTASLGTAYRMGGDEFCLIAVIDAAQGPALVETAVEALTDRGEGWAVTCSWGVAWIPADASGAGQALRIADERMYAQKSAGRRPASRFPSSQV
jgi:diguanylate cyclase (GGDEF)-like protein